MNTLTADAKTCQPYSTGATRRYFPRRWCSYRYFEDSYSFNCHSLYHLARSVHKVVKSCGLASPAMVYSSLWVSYDQSQVLKYNSYRGLYCKMPLKNKLKRTSTVSAFTKTSWIALSRGVCPDSRTIESRIQLKTPMTPKMWPTKPRIGRPCCHTQDPTRRKG